MQVENDYMPRGPSHIGNWLIDPGGEHEPSDRVLVSAEWRHDVNGKPVITVFCNGYPVWAIEPANGNYEMSGWTEPTEKDSAFTLAWGAFVNAIDECRQEDYQLFKAGKLPLLDLADYGDGYGTTEMRGIVGEAAFRRWPNDFPRPQGF